MVRINAYLNIVGPDKLNSQGKDDAVHMFSLHINMIRYGVFGESVGPSLTTPRVHPRDFHSSAKN